MGGIRTFDSLWIMIYDIEAECFDGGIFERVFQSRQRVKNTAERPDIDWERVHPMLDNFRSKVNRSPDARGEKIIGIMDNFGHTKITNFVMATLSLKYILHLDISMDDIFIVQVFQCRYESLKNIPKFFLSEFFLPLYSHFDFLYQILGT